MQNFTNRLAFFSDLRNLLGMPKTNCRIVLVTAPSAVVARKIAKSALEKHLIACANIVPRIESLYWWQGKIDQSKEVLLVLKTQGGKLAVLEQDVLANHPYDTPEFVILDIAGGNKRYLQWLTDCVKG